jgi:hypothetical protein
MLQIFDCLKIFEILAQSSSEAIRHLGKIVEYLEESGRNEPSVLSILAEWQTLIAGVIAFLPASVAAIFVWKQLDEQRTQYLQVQNSVSIKARMRLSRNLAIISHHFDNCFERLMSGDFSREGHNLPNDLLDDILDVGVASSEKNFAFFRKYIEIIQQYESVCNLYENYKGEENLVKCFKLLATADLMTDQIYPFARFEVEQIEPEKFDQKHINKQLLENLRRGKDISGSNLDELVKLGWFQDDL